VVPATSPVTTPVPDTLAVVVGELPQKPGGTGPLDSAVVEPAHTVNVPVMAGGAAVTVAVATV